MATFIFYNKYIDKDTKQEIDFTMSSEDMSNPLIFKEKLNDKKTESFLLVPNYLGVQNSVKKFQFWYLRDNPLFKVYPQQRYLYKSFPKNKDFIFLPYIKEVKRTAQVILSIKDDYNNDIMYDDREVFMKSYNTIQIDKDFLANNIGNHLHLAVKLNPTLIELSDEVKSAIQENKQRIPGYIENTQQDKVVNDDKGIKIIKDNEIINVNSLDSTRTNKEIIDEFLEQEIDLPIQLIELLMLGVSCNARKGNVVQLDQRVGTTYIVNPYLERYELAVKKAIDNQYINQPGIEKRTVSTKGFF